MSFGMPSLKYQPETPSSGIKNSGEYEVPNLMLNGFTRPQSNAGPSHTLEASEANYAMSRHNLNMTILRNTQGLHAPLKIAMELKAAKKIGRLPFLTSSNVMFESLTGHDIEIGPEDIYNQPEFTEIVGQPHAMVERSLGLL